MEPLQKIIIGKNDKIINLDYRKLPFIVLNDGKYPYIVTKISKRIANSEIENWDHKILENATYELLYNLNECLNEINHPKLNQFIDYNFIKYMDNYQRIEFEDTLKDVIDDYVKAITFIDESNVIEMDENDSLHDDLYSFIIEYPIKFISNDLNKIIKFIYN